MELRLRYVSRETLPSGAERYRFRRNGVKVTLQGTPGSPEFLKHYAALLTGPQAPPVAVHGSVDWLVARYIDHLSQRVAAGLASPLTLKGHKHHLSRLTKAHGDRDANMPRGKLIELRDTFTATPGAADNFIKSVSALYKWAIARDLVECENPARDVSRINRSDGFYTWTPADFAAYVKKHTPGTKPHLALMLAIGTTARRADLVAIGAGHEFDRNGRRWLRWRQNKAPNRMVELPMSRALIAAATTHTPYLLTEYGRGFSIAGFGERFRSWCDAAGVSGSLHGVRKGIPSLLPSHGTTSLELDVLLGHEMNSDETKVYVADADRANLALSVIDRLDGILV